MFYMSTRGSSASIWVAKVLSKHPKVVCFRATRTFPPVAPHTMGHDLGILPLPVNKFIDGLIACEEATLGEKIFGSTHGYHGVAAKEHCEKRGGRFSYVVRHPITRVHSVFIANLHNRYYQKNKPDVTNANIHDHVCSVLLKDSNLIDYTTALKLDGKVKSTLKNILPPDLKQHLSNLRGLAIRNLVVKPRYKKELRALETGNIDEKAYVGQMFVDMVQSFFYYDNQIYNECSVDSGIKMEEMVKSKDYFKHHLWPHIAPEVSISDSYLDSVFTLPRVNIHRDIPLDPEKIWKDWPKGMKTVFQDYFERYNMASVCRRFDYDISFI
jgi:hypothetical protein